VIFLQVILQCVADTMPSLLEVLPVGGNWLVTRADGSLDGGPWWDSVICNYGQEWLFGSTAGGTCRLPGYPVHSDPECGHDSSKMGRASQLASDAGIGADSLAGTWLRLTQWLRFRTKLRQLQVTPMAILWLQVRGVKHAMARSLRCRHLRFVAMRLDPISIGIDDERSIVVRVIVGANAGRAVVAPARFQRGCVEGINAVPCWSRKTKMQS